MSQNVSQFNFWPNPSQSWWWNIRMGRESRRREQRAAWGEQERGTVCMISLGSKEGVSSRLRVSLSQHNRLEVQKQVSTQTLLCLCISVKHVAAIKDSILHFGRATSSYREINAHGYRRRVSHLFPLFWLKESNEDKWRHDMPCYDRK